MHVLLSDQRMPGTSGVAFLTQVRNEWPDVIRIIISGYTDSEDIIAGINDAGIYQYMLKPWHPEQLLLTLRRAVALYRLQENCRLSLELRAAEPFLRKQVATRRTHVQEVFHLDRIVRASDSPMQGLCAQIAKAARYNVPILLMGESGTGKELLARAVHCGSERNAGHGHGTATRHAAEGEAATRPDTVTIPQCGARPDDGRQRDVAAKVLRNTNHAGRNALR